jgi:hypothetical protein
MRCLSCNKGLNDHESTRKYASSGTFVDLCDRCFSTIAEEVPDIDGLEDMGEPSDEDSFDFGPGDSYDE